MSNYWNKIFTTFCFLALATLSFAQPKDNAPYSRFGLGNFVNQYFASAAGMGGLSATYADPFHANILNPASFGHLTTTVFEVGVFGERTNLQSGDQSQTIWSGNLNYLSLGFPLQNTLNSILERKVKPLKWGMNIAMIPYTQIGYDVQIEGVNPGNDTLDILTIYQGTGGTNRLIWSNGFKYGNLSGGFNLGFLFGKLERSRFSIYENLEATFDPRFIDDININGFIWNVGFQYRFLLNQKELDRNDGIGNRKSIVVGAYGNSKTGFSTTSNKLRIGINSRYGAQGFDTLLNVQNVSENGKLPAEFTGGLMYEHQNKMRLGIEYSFGKWSEYVNEATGEGTSEGTPLSDSKRFSAGVEWIPNATSYNNYFKRIRYRAGFVYQDDPRLADLKNIGASIGFGLPLILPRQQTSFINIAFELGKFGISDSIEETYFRTTVGFTMNDNSWFFKRKFN